MLCLPGVTDNSVQIGLQKLLDDPYPSVDDHAAFLDRDQERTVIEHLLSELLDRAPQRVFKFFGKLRDAKVNNHRTRRLILTTILQAHKLPLWSVKYRLKLRAALRHAWGDRVSNSVRLMVSVPDVPMSAEEEAAKRIVIRTTAKRHIYRYLKSDSDDRFQLISECLCFILGGYRSQYTIPIMRSFIDSKTDLDSGSHLPVEVLQGIRSRYHKDVPAARVIELTKKNVTEGQKLNMQAAAKRAGVELEFDPTKQDIVKLYIYCLQTGEFTDAIRDALHAKAALIAGAFPLRYDRIGLVVDTSLSMYGSDAGKNRPLAIGLAMRDVLAASAKESRIVYSGGEDGLILPKASGDTSLAEGLIDVIEPIDGVGPDAVYIITDGYENAPAGRVDEVIQALRRLGVATPIYQITPVMAAEKAGVRALSPAVAPLPVMRPESLGLSLIRAAINQDIERGILGLLNVTTVPLLGLDHGERL